MNDTQNQVFSVCILIYKNLNGLEASIKSVFDQTYQDIELFISDDHSIDSCELQKQYMENIIHPYRKRFKSVHINVNHKNIGTVKHVNSLLSQTSGRYICLLGSGDRLFQKNTLQNIAQFFRSSSYNVCFSKTQLNLNDHKSIILPKKHVIRAFHKQNASLLNLCCREVNHLTTIGSFFTKELFETYGYFDESYTLLEDAPFFLNLLFQNTPLGFVDEITCIHEKGGISNQKKTDAVLKKDSLRTLTELKYKNRARLDWFTRRVVCLKYCLRTPTTMAAKIGGCLKYPDAVLFMALYVFGDWLHRKRYLERK